jgi:hypothetical protein
MSSKASAGSGKPLGQSLLAPPLLLEGRLFGHELKAALLSLGHPASPAYLITVWPLDCPKREPMMPSGLKMIITTRTAP